ncbi:alcohol dehydrogenase catalytic domain-containing protein [Streptomyces sp. NPDC056411]|uniref:alcohol dehydrogenase catalytic domain-containing protein n=1 Tax=Streptomyces sp. NPDC056411 TaxID=3345813 RepID=UPI0035D80DDE
MSGSDTMRAFVLRETGEVAVMEKPVPEPGPNDVVIRTTAAMVCTSDIHTASGGMPVPPDWTMGHEAVGTVHAVGSAVTGLTVGSRVAVGGVIPCFQCDSCQRGFSSQCGGRTMGAAAYTQHGGMLAEYFLVPHAQANVVAIPDSVTDHAAVYATDMLSTGFVAAEHAELKLGETVAVLGQGAVGLSATVGCRLLGAGLVIAVEPVPRRQELARHFGADLVIDPAEGNTVEQIRELTGGLGADAVIEAYGSPGTWQDAFRATKPGGRISSVGYHADAGGPLVVPHDAIGHGMADKQLYMGFNAGGRERLGRILRLIENGRVDPTAMTTHQFGFDRIVDAFHAMAQQEGGIIKPLITFPS